MTQSRIGSLSSLSSPPPARSRNGAGSSPDERNSPANSNAVSRPISGNVPTFISRPQPKSSFTVNSLRPSLWPNLIGTGQNRTLAFVVITLAERMRESSFYLPLDCASSSNSLHFTDETDIAAVQGNRRCRVQGGILSAAGLYRQPAVADAQRCIKAKAQT